MIVEKTLARPYARALFELASETGTQERWSEALSLLTHIVQDKAVSALISDRLLPLDKLLPFLRSLQPAVLEERDVSCLLHLLAERRRLRLLPHIFSVFNDLYRAQKNQKIFRVVSAVPLKTDQQQKFREYLTQRFACQAQVTFEKRDDMLGGVQIFGEDWVMDYSIKGLLKQLYEQLSVGV